MVTRQPRPSEVAVPTVSRQHPPFAGRIVEVLRELFPVAEPTRGRRSRGLAIGLAISLEIVAVVAGSVVVLQRVAGIPAWEGIYAEDYGVFFPQALQHPWHLLTPDGGYIEFLPRLIAQLVTYLPLSGTAAAFAVSGAVVCCLSALVIFHASAGFIRSRWLRALLALSVLLLPVAPLEIIDSGVGSPWYLLIALFFAMLWRPQSRAGMAVAALVGFMTAASTILSVVLVPLLIARLIALPRVREHAVTAGWAAGTLLQLPSVVQSLVGARGSRVNKLTPFHEVVAFYGHDVVLPAFGWHLSWWLKSAVGLDAGMAIAGGFLVIVFGWAMITQGRQARVFIVAALLMGFIEIVVAGTLSWWVPPHAVTFAFEPGSRYSDLPILLIDAALIVAVDSLARRTRARWRTISAVTALVALLASGWVADFRDYANRSNSTDWKSVVGSWERSCQNHPERVLNQATGPAYVIQVPCDRLHL